MAKKRSTSKATAALASEASFIFRGTVQAAKDSTLPEAKAEAGTAVVRVDEVIAAPPTLARIAGRQVTVVLAGSRKAMKAGEQAVFHASSVSFGREIAVQAIRAEPLATVAPSGGIHAARAAAAPLAAAAVSAVDPVQAHRDMRLKRSLDSADVVVAGTVTQVRVAPETEAFALATSATGTRALGARRRGVGRLAAGTTGTPRLISEHDPIWHEAVVNVDSVEKGATGQKQVTVRFPASNDVRWRFHPKLRPGQQGVFLLKADAPSASMTAQATTAARSRAGGARLTTMPVPMLQRTAMQATSDPQPISAIQQVRQLLSLSPTSLAAARTATTRRRSVRTSSARKRKRTPAPIKR